MLQQYQVFLRYFFVCDSFWLYTSTHCAVQILSFAPLHTPSLFVWFFLSSFYFSIPFQLRYAHSAHTHSYHTQYLPAEKIPMHEKIRLENTAITFEMFRIHIMSCVVHQMAGTLDKYGDLFLIGNFFLFLDNTPKLSETFSKNNVAVCVCVSVNERVCVCLLDDFLVRAFPNATQINFALARLMAITHKMSHE